MSREFAAQLQVGRPWRQEGAEAEQESSEEGRYLVLGVKKDMMDCCFCDCGWELGDVLAPASAEQAHQGNDQHPW